MWLLWARLLGSLCRQCAALQCAALRSHLYCRRMRHWQAPCALWYTVVTGGNQPIFIQLSSFALALFWLPSSSATLEFEKLDGGTVHAALRTKWNDPCVNSETLASFHTLRHFTLDALPKLLIIFVHDHPSFAPYAEIVAFHISTPMHASLSWSCYSLCQLLFPSQDQIIDLINFFSTWKELHALVLSHYQLIAFTHIHFPNLLPDHPLSWPSPTCTFYTSIYRLVDTDCLHWHFYTIEYSYTMELRQLWKLIQNNCLSHLLL